MFRNDNNDFVDFTDDKINKVNKKKRKNRTYQRNSTNTVNQTRSVRDTTQNKSTVNYNKNVNQSTRNTTSYNRNTNSRKTPNKSMIKFIPIAIVAIFTIGGNIISSISDFIEQSNYEDTYIDNGVVEEYVDTTEEVADTIDIEVTGIIDNFSDYDEWAAPEEGFRYVRIEFTLTAKEEVSIHPFYFQLETEQAYYDYAILIDNNIGEVGFEDLNQGDVKSYYLAFEVPVNENAIGLIFDDWTNVIGFPVN